MGAPNYSVLINKQKDSEGSSVLWSGQELRFLLPSCPASLSCHPMVQEGLGSSHHNHIPISRKKEDMKGTQSFIF